MPTYDYECDGCGHEFELFQPITAVPQRVCPECQQRTLRRLFGTGAAVVFKGSGFYRNDSRAGGKSGGSSATSGNGAKDTKSGSTATPSSESGSGSGSTAKDASPKTASVSKAAAPSS